MSIPIKQLRQRIWSLVTANSRASRAGNRRQRLAFEPLEPRLALSAQGLVDVGAQPEGNFSSKIFYLHPGHGFENQDGSWNFQRSEVAGTEMIEDLGNYDQMTFLADYLFRAGATIVPLRPIGHQTSEIILDNDSASVQFVGSWSDSTSPIFYGNAGDLPYKYASTSANETAYARYRPTVGQAGFYPVYAWTRSGSDRATDQLYRVNHSGGITEVTINHRRVGNGLVYLGTYHFEAGTNGYVDISNRSTSADSVVIADMIRFGNGIGESGLPIEDEAGLYWIERMAAPPYAQGISSAEYGTSVVTAGPKYAEYMNRESDGVLSDRVFLSYHSNAAGTTARGVLALHNTSHGGDTPNQVLLAQTLADEINADLVAQNAQWDPDWASRSNRLYENPDFNYGEINNLYINDEFDATIVEVAFHDNQLDAQLMREANVRDAVGRATYQGLIKYFRSIDGNATPATELPPPVTSVRATTNGIGSVLVNWVPPVTSTQAGGTPIGYRVYGSTNGYGFDGGAYVNGGASVVAVLTGLDPNLPYYFKVVAVNAGGESAASEVVAVLPTGGRTDILIVNGFDRLDRSMNPREARIQTDANGLIDRVRPRESNSRDYVVQVMQAIQTAAPGTRVNSTSNEAVISGAVNLKNYGTVIWISGEESVVNDTFDATEQTNVTQFLLSGGNLFVTGSEIGWDLDQQNNGRTFYETTLKANYVSDSAGTYAVNGSASSIFAGLNFSFDNGAQFYNSEFADVINPQAGAQAALLYANGSGSAGIISRGTGTNGDIVVFGFPFETITTPANRALVMERVLDFVKNADFDRNGVVDASDYVVWRKSAGQNVSRGTQGDADGSGFVDSDDYMIWRAQFGNSIPVTGSGASLASASADTFGEISSSAVANELSSQSIAPQDAAFAVFGNNSEIVSQRRIVEGRQSLATRATRYDWAMLADLAERKLKSSIAAKSEESDHACQTGNGASSSDAAFEHVLAKNISEAVLAARLATQRFGKN